MVNVVRLHCCCVLVCTLSLTAVAQTIAIKPVLSWHDARLLHSDVVLHHVMNVYSNGTLVRYSDSLGRAEIVSTPKALLVAELCEHQNAAWVRMITGEVYRTVDFVHWTSELRGVESMYRDEHDVLYIVDSVAVYKVVDAGGNRLKELVAVVPRTVNVSGLLARNDTALISLADRSGSIVAHRGQLYFQRKVYFTKAVAVSGDLSVLSNDTDVWLNMSMSKEDSLIIQRPSLSCRYMMCSSSLHDNDRVVTFSAIDYMTKKPLFGRVRHSGIEFLGTEVNQDESALALTSINERLTFTNINSRFRTASPQGVGEHCAQDRCDIEGIHVVPYMSVGQLVGLGVCASAKGPSSGEKIFMRYADGGALVELKDTARALFETFESAFLTAKGTEVVVGRPNIYRKMSTGKYARVSDAVNIAGRTAALPVVLDDNTYLVHSSSNRYLYSIDAGSTWRQVVFSGIREFSTNVIFSDSLLAIECRGEWAVYRRGDLWRDTLTKLIHRYSNGYTCAAMVTSTSATVIAGESLSSSDTTLHALWAFHYAEGQIDSVLLKLPIALSRNSAISCVQLLDTLLIFSLSGGRNTAQLSAFVNGKLASHRYIPTASFAPLNTLMNTSVRFVGRKTIELTRIDQGLQATIDLSEDEVSSVETPTHEPHGKLSIYPNPASTSTTINLPEGFASQEGVNVDIYDALSEQCIHTTLQVQQAPYNAQLSLQLDIASLQSGAYMVVVRGAAGAMSTTLTINR